MTVTVPNIDYDGGETYLHYIPRLEALGLVAHAEPYSGGFDPGFVADAALNVYKVGTPSIENVEGTEVEVGTELNVVYNGAGDGGGDGGDGGGTGAGDVPGAVTAGSWRRKTFFAGWPR